MIELQDVSVIFHAGTPSQHRVLSHLNLTVPHGQFVTIIGGNGAGKSTLMGVLAGETPVSRGRILLGDREVTHLGAAARSKDIARVFQDPATGTCGDLSVAENLALARVRGQARGLGLARSALRDKELRARTAQLGIGLENRFDTPVGLLSGGQRQCLSLLMATLRPSKLLLLDEHTAALDPKMADVVLALTRELIETHQLTAVMVTHAMEVALTMGSRTVMLERGQIGLDVTGAERKRLNPQDLRGRFHAA